jgi:tetratricopeptide (TPR) repeat protein
LHVPPDVQAPIELQVKLRYRKFDYEYLSLVYAEAGKVPQLPIVDICEDRLTLPVAGIAADVPPQSSPIKPAWQRWNDYGIGCFLEGGVGTKKGELRQAEEAFRHLLTLGEKDAHAHGYLNVARVYFDEGRLREAVEALGQAQRTEPPAPWWTVAWFTGLVNAQNGYLDEAIANFEKILDPNNQPRDRKFNFTRDYVVSNELGATLFKRAQQEDDAAERARFLRRAVDRYEATLAIDPEDLDAHYGLAQCYGRLGELNGPAPANGGPAKPEEENVTALVKAFTNGTAATEQRLQAAATLCRAIPKLGQQPTRADQPKLPALLAAIQECQPVYRQEAEGSLRAAAAQVLGHLFRQTHAIFKPDDNAKDRAIRIYREKHRAAAEASQAIVIYPTNRELPGRQSQDSRTDEE